jgi:hypothetical protein
MLRKATTGLIKDITKNKIGPNPEENPYIKLILIPTLSSLNLRTVIALKNVQKTPVAIPPKTARITP